MAVNNGLTNTFILALAENSAGDLFAGTFEGGGVYRSTDDGGNWSLVINGLTNTYVPTLAVNDDDNVFAGTWGGGVFRSTDNGDSWIESNNGLIGLYVTSLAINAQGHLFAGTDFGEGVYRSTDDGDSWSALTFPSSNNVYAIVFDPSGDVYAGTYEDGAYRSTDNGDTWTEVNNGLTAGYVLSMAVNSSGTVFAGTYFGGGAFRTMDSGANWTQINNGLIATEVRALTSNDGFLYAGTYGIGVFRSPDSGENWTAVNNGLTATYVTSLTTNQDGDIFAGADFIDNNGGVFRSTDDGDTWTNVSGPISTDVRALAINSSGHIFAGTYFGGGVYRSTDNGNNWTQINNGLTCPYIWSFGIDSEDRLFAGSAGCGVGVFLSTDNGDSWTPANAGLTSTDITSLGFNHPGDVFAGTYYGGGIFRSTDNGMNWTAVNNGLSNTNPSSFAFPLFSDNLYEGFAGTAGGVFATSYGDEWYEYNDGLTALDVRALLSPDDRYLYAGTAGGGVFVVQLPVSVEDDSPFPTLYELSQNFPNPFNPKSLITFQLPGEERVTLTVYDILGRAVATLVDGRLPAGQHHIEFNATGLAGGVYFYTLHAGSFMATKKMVYLP
jgi:photosystem II stability/assembly factor-like uncharacterized protein